MLARSNNMIVKVRCLKCGREVTIRLKKIEDAVKLTCKKCKEST